MGFSALFLWKAFDQITSIAVETLKTFKNHVSCSIAHATKPNQFAMSMFTRGIIYKVFTLTVYVNIFFLKYHKSNIDRYLNQSLMIESLYVIWNMHIFHYMLSLIGSLMEFIEFSFFAYNHAR